MYNPAPPFREPPPLGFEPIKAKTPILDRNNPEHAEIIRRLKIHAERELGHRHDEQIIDYTEQFKKAKPYLDKEENPPEKLRKKLIEGRNKSIEWMEPVFKKYGLDPSNAGSRSLEQNEITGDGIREKIMKEMYEKIMKRKGLGAAAQEGKLLAGNIMATESVVTNSAPQFPAGAGGKAVTPEI